jgi:hypothetical protein
LLTTDITHDKGKGKKVKVQPIRGHEGPEREREREREREMYSSTLPSTSALDAPLAVNTK